MGSCAAFTTWKAATVKRSWSLVMLVLVLASIVALWPRTGTSNPDVASGDRGPLPNNVAPVGPDPTLSRPPEGGTTGPVGSLCPVSEPEPGRGGPLAGVTARCLGEKVDVDLAEALGGEVTLINLWASWCAPCRTEMPVLDTYAAQPDAIRVVGIDVEDRPDNAAALVSELGIRYPNYIDGGGVQDALAAPPILPLSFILGPDGAITRITAPAVFETTEQIRTAVEEYTP